MDRAQQILVIGLDGFDVAVAERLSREGLLPHFTRLRAEGARFDLDHGRDKYSGLAWEHFSSGVSPSDGGRWSAVAFDKQTYRARQDYTTARPFLAGVAAKAVIFDLPYFDLSLAPNVRGMTAWAAHDPGVAPASRPGGLHEELLQRFGPYPAPEWIYGFCWPSARKAKAAGDALARATDMRLQASRWLFKDRLPDWDLGIVVVGECHSAIEPLWHGLDEDHPLHSLDSAAPAAAGLRQVYAAIDRLIGDLQQTFAGSTLVLAAMHGMGPNQSDVAAMVLLPELLYRFAFGTPHMGPVRFARSLADGTPVLAEDAYWGDALLGAIPHANPWPRRYERVASRIRRTLSGTNAVPTSTDLHWMPAFRYAHLWPKMPAFALPAYYDGRIRLNIAGREADGTVPAGEYGKMCREVGNLISECRNLLNNKPVASEIYSPKQNPHEVGPTEADLYVVWEGAPLGFSHPRLGSIGPVPYNRTGGHTGQHGFLNVSGGGIAPGHRGLASSFDVVPTLVDLLGGSRAPGVSGRSLVPRLAAAESRDTVR